MTTMFQKLLFSLTLISITGILSAQKTPCSSWEAFPKGVQTAKETHSIYRDFFKIGQYEKAYPNWELLYATVKSPKEVPNRHFDDGILMISKFMEKEPDSAKRAVWLPKLMQIYDDREACMGLDASNLAYKAYYMYSYKADADKTTTAFQKALDAGKEKTTYFILNAATDHILKQFEKGKTTKEETQKAIRTILSACEYGTTKGEANLQQYYKTSYDWILQRLDGPDKQLMDCAWFVKKIKPAFLTNQENRGKISEYAKTLRTQGCPESDSLLSVLTIKERQYRREDSIKQVQADSIHKASQTPEGIVAAYEVALAKETDTKKKADLHYNLAQGYFGLKNFSRAREHARSASALRPKWGKPWLLIGSLYASSGKMCDPTGVGRGFEAQVVTWVAIDAWNKAKAVDPSVKSEANKKIAEYAQYMPTSADLFQRGLKSGAPYRIHCWIQESTTIRAKK